MYKYSRLPHHRSTFVLFSPFGSYTHIDPDCTTFSSHARRLKLVQNHIYHKTGRLHPIRRLIDLGNAVKPKESRGELHSSSYLSIVSLTFIQPNLRDPSWLINPRVLGQSKNCRQTLLHQQHTPPTLQIVVTPACPPRTASLVDVLSS